MFETKRLIVRTVLYSSVALLFFLIMYLMGRESFLYYATYPELAKEGIQNYTVVLQ